jgi:hypothetical protein
MMIGNQQSAQLMQCMASQDEFDCFWEKFKFKKAIDGTILNKLEKKKHWKWDYNCDLLFVKPI